MQDVIRGITGWRINADRGSAPIIYGHTRANSKTSDNSGSAGCCYCFNPQDTIDKIYLRKR
ncbi:MAG: hypothetical protein AB1454_13415 [Candidatus Auribacterota bacterium]